MTELTPIVINQGGVQRLIRRGAQLVEVLSAKEYQRVHLAGAINLPLEEIDRKSADQLAWDQPVIVYCGDFQ